MKFFLPFEPAAHAAGLHFLRDGAKHGRLPPLLGDLAVLPCGVMRSMPPPPLSLFLDAIRDALEGVEDGRRGHVAAAGSGVVCAGRPPCRCGGLWWPSGVVRDHSYKRAGGWACTHQHGRSIFHRQMNFCRISTVRSTVADLPATAASGRTGCCMSVYVYFLHFVNYVYFVNIDFEKRDCRFCPQMHVILWEPCYLSSR